jgi:hypothetical protein
VADVVCGQDRLRALVLSKVTRPSTLKLPTSTLTSRSFLLHPGIAMTLRQSSSFENVKGARGGGRFLPVSNLALALNLQCVR